MKVKFLKAGKWHDKPWEPQFEVEESEVVDLSPDMASIVIACGAGKLFDPESEDEAGSQGEDNDDNDGQGEPEPKTAADYDIKEIGLVDALLTKLEANGVTTVEQLVEKTEQEILDFDGVGKAKVDDIVDALEKIGLSLKVSE